MDRLLALRSRVTVPLGHVLAVREHAAEADFDSIADCSRGVGTFIRGRVAAGSLRLPDGRAFYDVHDPHRAIVVDLKGETFEHLVVEIDDEPPEAAAGRIRGALEHRASMRANGSGAETRRRAGSPLEPGDAPAPSAGERRGMPAWKSLLAAAGAIVLAPIAAITFVFVAPALVPILVLALPSLPEPGSQGAGKRRA